MSSLKSDFDESFLEKIYESRQEDPVRKRIRNQLPMDLKKIEEFGKDGKYPSGIQVSDTDESLMKMTGGVFQDRLKNVRGSESNPGSDKNGEALVIGKKYGLVKCDFQGGRYTRPCTGLIIARGGQKTARCPKCGRSRHLKNTVLLYQANNQKRIRKKMGEIKRRGGLYK